MISTHANAVAPGKGHGVKDQKKAASFHTEECQFPRSAATFFWDRNANCIARLADLKGGA
jgi:hypothetical protein